MILRGAIIFGFAWLVLTQTPQPGITHVPSCVAHACAGVSLNAWQDHVILHLAEMKQASGEQRLRASNAVLCG